MKKTSKILSVIMVLALLVTSMMISTVSVQAAEEVVLEWDFTDGAKDISGKGNDGTIGDGVEVKDGQAVFTGSTNAGITLPEGVLGDAEVVTFEFVLTPSVLNNYVTILGIGELETDWVVMTLMADGAVRYAVVTDGLAEDKGNSTLTDAGSNGGTIEYQSEEFIALNEEVTLTYIVEQEQTTVQIEGEDALILGTYDKSLISGLEGPIVLGKATKWPDPSFEGSINSFKITVGTPDADEPADPTDEPATDDPAATPEATEEATETPEATESATATKAPTPTKAPTTAPTSTADTGSSDGETPVGLIVGIIAAVVVIVVVVVVVVVKKKK